MSDKISVQQRKYFVERIEKSINEKINELRQTNAAEVQNISERQYKGYLKELGINKDFDRYTKLINELERIASRLRAINDELVAVLTKGKPYDCNKPSLYSTFSAIDLDRAFRWCCNKTAQQHETETEAGKMIRLLEAKKRAATDELHGINELNGLKKTVNSILKGADVPLLGQ